MEVKCRYIVANNMMASYQEQRIVAVLCGVLQVRERLSPESAARDVQGLCQGHVVLGVHEQVEVRAENLPHGHFHLEIVNRMDFIKVKHYHSRLENILQIS